MRNILLIFAFFCCVAATAQIKEPQIRKHVRFLASDSVMGRATGSDGEKMAGTYIEKEFRELKLIPKGDNKTFYQSFPFKSGVHGTGQEGTGRNVIAYINNKAVSTIIIGAHYDHLGMGNDGNSLDANPQNKIHNGA